MGLLSRVLGGGEELPPDALRLQQLAHGPQCLHADAGLPCAVDACAYEPTQRLLAVSKLHQRAARPPARPPCAGPPRRALSPPAACVGRTCVARGHRPTSPATARPTLRAGR